MTPERKLWHELKRNTPQITWTRLENFAGFGTPDLLGYNNSGHFFTVELKITKANKIRFSPHQISFHITHPKNTFILVKALGPCTMKLFPGSLIQELVKEGYACGSGVPGPWSTVLEPLLACWLCVGPACCLLVCMCLLVFSFFLGSIVNAKLLHRWRSSGLMFSVLNFFDIFVPTCATAAALHTLFWGRAHVSSSRLRYHGGPVSPGVAGLRIIFCVA